MSNVFDGWGEDFAFSSGLLDDFDGTIVDAAFTFDARYNNGDTCVLALDIKPTDEDAGVDIVRQLYPCGADWKPADGGSRCVRASGRDTGFNKSAGVVQFLSGVATCGNEAKEYLLAAGFKPTDCSALPGTTWHWKFKPQDFNVKDKATGETKKGTSERLVPTAFLTAAAPKKKGRMPRGVQTQFADIAKQCDTHADFIKKVDEEYEDWSEWEEFVLSEDWFDKIK